MRSAPLGNREIAFGCVRLAIRRPCTGPLGWRARSSPRLARARGGFRRASTPRGCLRTLRVRLRRIFPPLRFGAFPRIRLHPRGAIHPPLRRAWLGREASLRQSHPSRRRLAPRGAGFALAPWQARLAPCALSALVRFCGARSAPLTVSKVSALARNCAESSPFALSPCHGSAERAGGAAARGGGGDGGRRGRRQARCRRSGDGRYSDRAGRRQTAPHADAAPRRNPPEPEMCRSEAEGSRERSEAPEGAARRHVRRTSCRTLAQR